MKKQAVYYFDEKGGNPVWEFISGLPPDERGKCFEYIAYLEAMGELRPKQTRIIYFFMLKDYAVLVHAFRKKTDAVPEREIKTAFRNMEDFVSRHQKGQIRLGGSK